MRINFVHGVMMLFLLNAFYFRHCQLIMLLSLCKLILNKNQVLVVFRDLLHLRSTGLILNHYIRILILDLWNSLERAILCLPILIHMFTIQFRINNPIKLLWYFLFLKSSTEWISQTIRISCSVILFCIIQTPDASEFVTRIQLLFTCILVRLLYNFYLMTHDMPVLPCMSHIVFLDCQWLLKLFYLILNQRFLLLIMLF